MIGSIAGEYIVARKLKIALVQARPANGIIDSEKNIEHAVELLRRACRGEPDIVVFPEYFPFHDSRELGVAARDCSMYVVAGVKYSEEDRVYNTATVYGLDGEPILRQFKRYIGRLEARLWGFKPTNRDYKVLDIGNAKIGIVVCADFWSFPEAAFELFLGGAELFINPSYMFSMHEHWLKATLSRSLEFYAPVVGVDTAVFELKTQRHVFRGGGYSHVIVPPSTEEEALEWWASGASSADSWIRLVMGTDEDIAFYDVELDSITALRRDWWRRMRGVELEEWIKETKKFHRYAGVVRA